MFNIILTVVIFHSLSALALFAIFTLSASASARRQAVAGAQEYGTSYSHG